ncbi:glutamate-5-semialdehyde dehydrogenase [Hydrogenobaculum acidophilum]
MREYALEIAKKAKSVLPKLSSLTPATKNSVLLRVSKLLIENKELIQKENEKDLEFAKSIGLSKAMIDRLRVGEKQINSMVKVLEDVAKLKDPVGEITSMWTVDNGLKIGRMRVPLGVIFIVYESRPNVTIEAASLCFKSSNAVILRGGKEALHTNKILADLFRQAIKEYVDGLEDAVSFVDRREREIVTELLQLEGLVDVAIPRGGESLIKAVSETAKIPVIKHYKGVCSIYVDNEADLKKAYDIVYNAKVQRPSVCNAIENLIVHKDLLKDFWPKMAMVLLESSVELRCDEDTYNALQTKDFEAFKDKIKKATEDDYYEEFLDLILAVKTVNSLEEAMDFIEKYGSKHSDAIITENHTKAMRFLQEVDSAAVYVNASTRFTDGNEFGLGAEMGISTDKIHARGPMALRELTIEKFIIFGNGQLRENVGIPEELKKKLDLE